MKIKKGDTVKILSGDDKGKKGKVLGVFPKLNKVLVEGINVVKRHERPRKQGSKGQVVDKAMPLNVSKVTKVE
jgi:large subunit ribosomal protein L24